MDLKLLDEIKDLIYFFYKQILIIIISTIVFGMLGGLLAIHKSSTSTNYNNQFIVLIQDKNLSSTNVKSAKLFKALKDNEHKSISNYGNIIASDYVHDKAVKLIKQGKNPVYNNQYKKNVADLIKDNHRNKLLKNKLSVSLKSKKNNDVFYVKFKSQKGSTKDSFIGLSNATMYYFINNINNMGGTNYKFTVLANKVNKKVQHHKPNKYIILGLAVGLALGLIYFLYYLFKNREIYGDTYLIDELKIKNLGHY